MSTAGLRPKNLNLFSIRLPLPALVSILHRVSGLVLFLLVPVLILALQNSLASTETYDQLVRWMHQPAAKLLEAGLILSLVHHLFAGVRHLAMDVHWGTALVQARRTGRLVLMLDAVVAMSFVLWIW